MIRVTVRGLDGYIAELEIAENRLVSGVRDLMSELASDAATDARSRAYAQRLSGDSSSSIRSQGPVIQAGASIPWYGFADFGGTTGVKRSIKRTYIKGGRWLFPAIRDLGIFKRGDALIDKVAEGFNK